MQVYTQTHTQKQTHTIDALFFPFTFLEARKERLRHGPGACHAHGSLRRYQVDACVPYNQHVNSARVGRLRMFRVSRLCDRSVACPAHGPLLRCTLNLKHEHKQKHNRHLVLDVDFDLGQDGGSLRSTGGTARALFPSQVPSSSSSSSSSSALLPSSIEKSESR